MEWQPIETAPKGISSRGDLPYSRMMLSIPHEDGGFNVSSGMRVGDKFYACLTFHCGGPFDGKQLELRETEVKPSHWMPIPEAPE